MAWTEKKRITRFDSGSPIEGLFYLDGDALAKRVRQPWSRGQKYPMVAFDAGTQFPIWEASDPKRVGIVHLFGEMDLPLKDAIDSALERAHDIAGQCGYSARRVAENQLEVSGHTPEEHLRITYDAQTGRMADVAPITDNYEQPVHQAHVLMNDEIRAKLPPLYSNEQKGMDALAPVKYFHPQSSWTWYASEGSPVDADGMMDTDREKVDFLFFGLVFGYEVEVGYFSLSELEGIGQDGRGILPVERDLYYEPRSLQDLMDEYRKTHGGS